MERNGSEKYSNHLLKPAVQTTPCTVTVNMHLLLSHPLTHLSCLRAYSSILILLTKSRMRFSWPLRSPCRKATLAWSRHQTGKCGGESQRNSQQTQLINTRQDYKHTHKSPPADINHRMGLHAHQYTLHWAVVNQPTTPCLHMTSNKLQSQS